MTKFRRYLFSVEIPIPVHRKLNSGTKNCFLGTTCHKINVAGKIIHTYCTIISLVNNLEGI